MDPIGILSQLTAAGIRLEVRGETLHASPRAALTDEARALIGAHKAALLALLSRPESEADRPRRLWSIRHAEGASASHSFTPPATLAEVRGWYPAALDIRPEPEPMEPGT